MPPKYTVYEDLADRVPNCEDAMACAKCHDKLTKPGLQSASRRKHMKTYAHVCRKKRAERRTSSHNTHTHRHMHALSPTHSRTPARTHAHIHAHHAHRHRRAAAFHRELAIAQVMATSCTFGAAWPEDGLGRLPESRRSNVGVCIWTVDCAMPNESPFYHQSHGAPYVPNPYTWRQWTCCDLGDMAHDAARNGTMGTIHSESPLHMSGRETTKAVGTHLSMQSEKHRLATRQTQESQPYQDRRLEGLPSS